MSTTPEPRVPAPVAAFATVAYLLVAGGFLYACWRLFAHFPILW